MAHSSFASLTPPLTIAAAVQHALEKNPDLLRAREALNQADSQFHTAISKALPSIAGQISAAYQKDSSLLNFANFNGEAFNQYEAFLTLNQPIYDGGALWAGFRYANKERQIQKYSLEISERSLKDSVITTYYSVLLNQKLADILKDTYKLDNETLSVAKRYYKIGRAQKLDVLQLQTETASLIPQISQADNLVQVSASQLATLIRDLNASEIRIKGRLDAPDPQWVQTIVQKKRSELPEVVQSRVMVDQAEDNTALQLAQYWPQLGIVGQIGRVAYAKTDLLDDAATSWSIGLQLSIPIFSGLSSISQKHALQAQERQLEDAETKTADTVSVNQIQTEKNLNVAETALKTSKQAADWGKQSLKEAQKQYRLQQINYLQYQTSIQAYLTSQTQYYQAKFNYIVAVAKYFEAVGIPLDYLVSKLDRLNSA